MRGPRPHTHTHTVNNYLPLQTDQWWLTGCGSEYLFCSSKRKQPWLWLNVTTSACISFPDKNNNWRKWRNWVDIVFRSFLGKIEPEGNRIKKWFKSLSSLKWSSLIYCICRAETIHLSLDKLIPIKFWKQVFRVLYDRKLDVFDCWFNKTSKQRPHLGF